MAIEIERKFLIDVKTFKSLSKNKDIELIIQAYLILQDNYHCRVRISSFKKSKKQKAVFATKVGKGIKRYEFEESVSLEHAKQLLKLALCSLKKQRIKIKHKGLTWDLDYYPNLNLAVAEVEIPSKKHRIEKPSWVKEEVSGSKKYSNIAIAKKSSKKA